MAKKKLKIDLNKLFDDIENMEQQEIESIFNIANCVYDCLDIPVVLLNDKAIKSNTLLIAMYLVGKEFGKAEQIQK